MTDLTLWQLATEFRETAAKLYDTDLPDEVIRDTLEGESGELVTKGANVAAVILNLDAQAEMVESAAKRLADKAKTLRNREKWLKSYLLSAMQATGISEIKSADGTFTARVKLNPESVEVLDELDVPPEYLRTKVMTEIDKARAKEAMKAGAEIAGLRLTRSQSLSIK